MTSPILATLSPELLDALKTRSKTTLATIVKANSATVFFQESLALTDLRKKLTALCNELNDFPDPLEVARIFSVVPLTTYDDYLPFVARFNETPCRASHVSNLLAPGLPVCLNNSSGTTNGPLKLFPKYNHAENSNATITFPDTPMCWIVSLGIVQRIDLMGDGDTKIGSIPSCFSSGSSVRNLHGVGYDNDESLMAQIFPNRTSPYAAYFIQPYRTILLIHALFALTNSALTGFVTTFSSLISDCIRLIEEHWDLLVQAIDSGVLPDLDGLDDSAKHLQGHLRPNAIRAAELRRVAVGTEGWLKKVWPQLTSISGIYAGPYQAAVPKLKYHFGPSVHLLSIGFGSTETAVAIPYDLRNHNLFKIDSGNVTEYLNVERPEMASELCQSWELEPGRKYELVATNRDGLWRYRLGDVFEAAGFDPVDGQPLLKFVERRTLTLRAAGEFTTEQTLRDGLASLKDTIGDVLEFTSFIDDRQTPYAYGFMVELESHSDLEPPTKTASAPALLHAFFSAHNDGYSRFSRAGAIGVPTIRVVAPGTFRMYRERKGDRKGASGQIKVPAVMHDASGRQWLSRQVVLEL